jgi:hypothetical protein
VPQKSKKSGATHQTGWLFYWRKEMTKQEITKQKITKQEIKVLLVECTEKLGYVPSSSQFVKWAGIARRQIRKHFGAYGFALKECNLDRSTSGGGGQKLPMEQLFLDWVGVVQKLKKLPSMSEYEVLSKHECSTLVRRFGSWRQVPHGLKQFAEMRGIAEQWTCELELVRRDGKAAGENAGGAMGPAGVPAKWPLALLNRPAYGSPMWPGPMAHSPANELGVVFLFGAMAERMGFVVHRLQAEFPDCEAIRQVGEDKWQKVRIEFEYESRNFLKHMHVASECDLIVCWKDNWPECPLEVVELRGEIAKIAVIAKIGN